MSFFIFFVLVSAPFVALNGKLTSERRTGFFVFLVVATLLVFLFKALFS